MLVARDEGRLDALAKELDDAHGAVAQVLPADLTDADQLRAVEDRCRDHDAPVDMLVNNAGFGIVRRVPHARPRRRGPRDPAQRRRARPAHARGRGRRWCARGRGGILNVSSLAGYQPGPMNATYGATKAFVTSFTEAVHEELRGTGVAVTVLCPGFTRTGFQETANVPASSVPGFMWQEADEVARAGLDALAKNRAVVHARARQQGARARSRA